MSSAPGVQLDSPPCDGISSVRFAEHADVLLVASWDNHVRLYDATLNILRVAFLQRAPVLDAAFMVRRDALQTRTPPSPDTLRARTRTRRSAAASTPPCGCTISTRHSKRCWGVTTCL
jgi:hypothetical protein